MEIKDVLQDKNNFYIVSEHLEGKNLYQRIYKKKFNENDARIIVKQILKALKYLH